MILVPILNSIWRNVENKDPVIYNNVVRSILCDDENNIWIGTASGVNRYDQTSKKWSL
jgi:ligand-binding sensor domain-containing protein